MKLKLLSAAALSFALMSGAALAQATSSTTTNPQTNGDPSNGSTFITDQQRMGVFFTDDTMATLRSDDELKTAWSGLSQDDQTALRSDCEALTKDGSQNIDKSSPSVMTFCGKVSAF